MGACSVRILLNIGIYGLRAVSETFDRKFDRNLARPWRNLKAKMWNRNYFKVHDHYTEFASDFANGLGRMMIIEDPKDYRA